MHDSETLEFNTSIETLVEELVSEAALGCERRSQPRAAFFVPVTLVQRRNGRDEEIRCFSRDISAEGMGLAYWAPFETGPAEVRIRRANGEVTCLPCEILWTRPCGEGWHLAGCRFMPTAQGSEA